MSPANTRATISPTCPASAWPTQMSRAVSSARNMAVFIRFMPLSLKLKYRFGSLQAHTVPLGGNPSQDLKTDHPVDLCHLVVQGQDVSRVMERAAEADRTLRDVHRN